MNSHAAKTPSARPPTEAPTAAPIMTVLSFVASGSTLGLVPGLLVGLLWGLWVALLSATELGFGALEGLAEDAILDVVAINVDVVDEDDGVGVAATPIVVMAVGDSAMIS